MTNWRIAVVLILAFSMVESLSPTAHAGEALLRWQPNTEPDLSGYKIYYRSVPGPFTHSINVGLASTPNAPEYTVTSLTVGTTYDFSLTAYDMLGNESEYSTSVSHTVIAGTETTPIVGYEDSSPLPVITAHAGPDQTVLIHTLVTLNGSASGGLDGSTTSYQWEQTEGLEVVLSNPDTQNPSFIPGTAGTYAFRLIISDGTLTSSPDTVLILVSGPGFKPPMADAGADQIVETGMLVTLDGSMSYDEETEMLRYTWIQVAGPQVPLNGQTSAHPQFYPVNTQTYSFELVVNNGSLNSTTDQVDIFVMDRVLAEGTITPEAGGALSIADGELSGVQLIVPPHALIEEIHMAIGQEFSLPPIDERSMIEVPVSFEPTGTSFAQPVTVTFPYDIVQYPQSDEVEAHIYQESTGTWETLPIASIDVEKGFVTVEISHFSSLAISVELNTSTSGFGCGAIMGPHHDGGNITPWPLDLLILLALILWLGLKKAKTPVTVPNQGHLV